MRYWLLAFCIGLLACGCAPTLAPHSTYIPGVRERGEGEVRLGTGVGGSELQLGYQATEKLVLHGGLLTVGRPNTDKGFRSADVGLGYYYLSPNSLWRLGMHTGVAYGGGTSGSNSCFECVGSGRTNSAYSVRYTYAYVQPTVIFIESDRRSFSMAVRLGQTYYHRLQEQRYVDLMADPELYSFAGRSSTFVQGMWQTDYRVKRWLRLSSRFGVQGFLGERSRLNDMSPFVAQGSLHFIINTKPQP